MPHQTLRQKARDAVQQGEVPARPPDRTWAEGPGVDTPCAVCASPIQRHELEFKIGFGPDCGVPSFDTYVVHVSCFAALEFERRTVEE